MSSLQEIIEKINQEASQEAEISYAGGMTLAIISAAQLLQDIVDTEQEQCVINTLNNWDKDYQISIPSRYSPAEGKNPPPQYETVRPAIAIAYGVYNKSGISLPDLLGHGELVKTTDGKLFYIGRVDPNWAQIMIAQEGFVKTKSIVGKNRSLAKALAKVSSTQFQKLSNYLTAASAGGGPFYKLALAQIGVISLGDAKNVYKYEWVNPLHMEQCSTTTWYGDIASWFMNFINNLFTKKNRAILIPLYTGRLLRGFETVDLSEWKEREDHPGIFSAYSSNFTTKLQQISQELPYGNITFAVNLTPSKYTPIVAPASFIGYTIKTRYDLPYSIYDILKVGIGAPVQSSFWCGNSCSQYGNFAQIVGLGTMTPIFFNNVAAYFGIIHPDYSKMSSEQIRAYFDEILGIGEAIQFSIVAAGILDVIYEEIKKKYGEEIANFTWTWAPYTDDQNEAKQSAEEIAQRGVKIVEKAKEIIRAMQINPTEEYDRNRLSEEVYPCLQVASPYGNIDEEAKKVVECAKNEVGFFTPQIERWYEESK